MFDNLLNSISGFFYSEYGLDNLPKILLFFVIAWVFHFIGKRISPRLLKLFKFIPRAERMRVERQRTLQTLIGGVLGALAYLAAVLASLRLFVGVDTLVWMVGLFSAAFGLGARPLLSDLLSGIGFLFEDTFSVGEKVELLGIEGVVEAVNLRTTWMRSPNGELYVIPNGEIRVIRNFSRGRFSVVRMHFKIEAELLNQAYTCLQNLGDEAVGVLPNLLEPWQVLSETGTIGQYTQLTLIAHARFGKAADMQPRLLAYVREKLTEEGIPLVD